MGDKNFFWYRNMQRKKSSHAMLFNADNFLLKRNV